MIISHRYQYIFIKTRKVAGTSVEMYLNKYRAPEDIFTPISSWHEGHISQNYEGIINPVKELLETKFSYIKNTLYDYIYKRKFWNHIPGLLIKSRVDPDIWNNYYKFTIERNPWDKTISHFYWLKRNGEDLSFKKYLETAFFPVDFDKYTDTNGKLLVDKVVRYENLNFELGNVFEELGVPFDGDLGIFAKSGYRKNRDYANFYDDKDKQLVFNIFKKEINLFNFEF